MMSPSRNKAPNCLLYENAWAERYNGQVFGGRSSGASMGRGFEKTFEVEINFGAAIRTIAKTGPAMR